MRKMKYNVRLTLDERNRLLNIISKGTASAKEIMHANVLLAADENSLTGRKGEAEIADLFKVHQQTVFIIRQRFCQQGLDAAISRKKREKPPHEIKITGEVEAKIIALSRTVPPRGYSRWSIRLLADKAVELNYINDISHTAVCRLLKKQTKAESS